MKGKILKETIQSIFVNIHFDTESYFLTYLLTKPCSLGGKTDLTGVNIIIASLPKILNIIERSCQVSYQEALLFTAWFFTRLCMLGTKEKERSLWKPGLRKQDRLKRDIC